MAILALDLGTTGSTALLLDKGGKTLGRKNVEFPQHFPQPGWVEHNPEEIWASISEATVAALAAAGLSGKDVEAIGITNQRETVLYWERETAKAVHNALVWQDQRTANLCKALNEAGHGDRVRELTGLVINPYFSASKAQWLLQYVEGLQKRAEAGDVAMGTIDSYMVYRLSGGAEHVTDVSNASRTLLYGLSSSDWEPELLDLFGVPKGVLPKVVPSSGVVARTKGFAPLPDGIPIAGIAGDQQAALFGQACFEEGASKCTYGTGAFVLVNTGATPKPSASGLLTTVAWQLGDEVTYALEGSAFIAGAAVQWLRDGLGLIKTAPEIEALASQVEDAGGVHFVPALTGLGAPYWDADARGAIVGLTRGATAAHLARATLEGIGFSVADLLRAMSQDLGSPLTRLRVDGGAAASNLLMQFQADVSNLAVERPSELESTARGAAMLAALGAGVVDNVSEAAQFAHIERTFEPSLADEARKDRLAGWAHAIRQARA